MVRCWARPVKHGGGAVVDAAAEAGHLAGVRLERAGKMRLEGKDYVVRDGDVMLFRFAN